MDLTACLTGALDNSDLLMVKQSSADAFWSWAEKRIAMQTTRLCEASVRDIADAVVKESQFDYRMRIVVTQSVVAPSKLSPFDTLASVIERNGYKAIRIRGSPKLSIESIHQSIIGACIGVTGSIATSDACQYTVRLKGLQISILEDLGIKQRVVFIVEEVDAIDKELLGKMIKLMFHFRSKNEFAAMVLESNLGEPLLEEVIDDEIIFTQISIENIPLVDSRELNARIRSIFFGNLSEVNIAGLPINFPTEHESLIRSEISQISVSSFDLCSNILLAVSEWFRGCDFSYLVGPCLARSDEMTSLLKNYNKNEKWKNFSSLVQVRQNLAISGRVVEIFTRALSGFSISHSWIDEFSCLRFSPSPVCTERVLTQIQSRRKSDRPIDTVIADCLNLLDLLIEDVIELGVTEDSDVFNALSELRNNVKPLAGRTFNVTKVFDELVACLGSFLANLELHASPDLEPVMKKLESSPSAGLERAQIDPDSFGSCVEFFRVKTVPKKASQLSELHEAVKAVFTGSAVTFGDYEELALNFKSKDFDLAEALAAMELLGLIRAPGAAETGSKIRRTYKDTWLVRNQKTEETVEDN